MSLITLGLHVSHNSSACLVKDGQILAAVQEERLSRVKQYEGFPADSIAFVLAKANLSVDDIDSVAIAGLNQHKENPYFVYGNPKSSLRYIFSKLSASIKARISLAFLDRFIYSKEGYKNYVYDALKQLGIDVNKVKMVDHHLSHIASAFYPSGYSEAIVISQDGRGDFLSGSVYKANASGLQLVYKQSASSSLAQLYAGVTMFLGFTPLKHEGKITGLAAFGKPNELTQKIVNLFEIKETGELIRKEISLDSEIQIPKGDLKKLKATAQEYFGFAEAGFVFQLWLKEHSNGISREDVAYAIQEATEQVLLKSVTATIQYLNIKKPISIGLAGGIFANVKLNQRIRESSKLVENVFVQPAMGDEGLAIGAAYLHQVENNVTIDQLRHVYMGNEYSDGEIEEELKKWSASYVYKKYDDIEREIAVQLADEKVVGRFNGAMEFGPRALGNRSILIHPTNKDINDIVNKRLKRTEFMPFAPSVLDYRAKDYFIGFDEKHLTADWMTITYDVYPEKVKEIDAVVHIDETARPQIVKSETNSSYHRILEEFNTLTGIGCFVNTSFNMHEEPIVASPFDAMRAFDLGSVDYLAIGNFIVEKK